MEVNDLRLYRDILSRQQIKTLKGQILSGNKAGAEKGLNTILERIKARNEEVTRVWQVDQKNK